MRLLYSSNSDIEQYIDQLEKDALEFKEDLYKIAWYMRGGVLANDLLYIYSYEDRKLMYKIIKDNIETTNKTGMPLM
jgi:hypothetical protein